ncbi:N-acetylmuramoyl-L-alanine amidase [Cutibacterium sp. WCA-380-WT-3A]|uniref:N-acetylmuramoyl-L-alanine amidase n=1 Tax=Cutibacterium porci TaxID=2605781 RepID=A0A7K0J7L1_9ACTN|nr:N-acetylmuramoyl-L-alanine amidase [Cutibacterium porci]
MKYIPATHHGGHTNTPFTRIVIHATCPDLGFPHASAGGQAKATARYFQSEQSAGSAHYVCDIAETIQCLPDDVIAWHAPPNRRSIGIEICADGGSRSSFQHPEHAYTRSQWLSPQVWPAVARAAALTRDLCHRHNIPMQQLSVADVKAGKHGICGHNDVSEAFHKSDHDDPGPTFPWDQFIKEVRTPGQQDTKPSVPTPSLTEIGDQDMNGCYYNLNSKTRTYLIFDSRSGFYHEFSQGNGNGPMSPDYVNPIAKGWDTGSWPAISPGHAKVLKAALDKVRKGI